MGCDKAQVRLGRRTLLGHVKAAADATDWHVKVIRKDVVERCGPLGGILTALKQSRAETLVFLSCDMPFISSTWIKKLVRVQKQTGAKAVFTQQEEFAGFPFVLCAETLEIVEQQRAQGRYSLQALAKVLKADMMDVPEKRIHEFMNVNTPEALEEAKRLTKR